MTPAARFEKTYEDQPSNPSVESGDRDPPDKKNGAPKGPAFFFDGYVVKFD